MKKSSMKFSAAFSKFMFYFGNIVIGIIFVSPLIWMISASLKPESQIFANINSLNTFFPVSASFNNYVEVFTRMNLPQVFKNTLLYIALILVLDLLVNSMCGYALAKFEFKGKGAIMNLVVALMVLPMEAIMLPLYIEMSQLGWVNTLAALVIPFVAKCFSIYMFRQFFCDIPDDLINAAKIDGCGRLRIFFKVVLPMVKSSIIALSIFTFVGAWNNFLWPMVSCSKQEMKTLPLALGMMKTLYNTDVGLTMACAVINFLPPFIFYVFMQSKFKEGMTLSGIKG